MEITYLAHSGFLIEWETCYWLFDYYKGDIPVMNTEKKIFVFVSHKHEDHYNSKIFELYDNYKDIQFVLSSDIKLSNEKMQKMGVPDEILDKILSVKPSNQYEIYVKDKESIVLQTLNSTDCGVAFLLFYQGKVIYHAGDLNLWVWKGETKQYNNNMTAKYNKEMDKLKDVRIDVAFVPLDPRQEEYYYMGMECLLNTANVKNVFPMHFWEKPSIIGQFKRDRVKDLTNSSTNIMDIYKDGQNWKIEI